MTWNAKTEAEALAADLWRHNVDCALSESETARLASALQRARDIGAEEGRRQVLEKASHVLDDPEDVESLRADRCPSCGSHDRFYAPGPCLYCNAPRALPSEPKEGT